MLMGSNCDRKSQFSEILTEPLNLREQCILYTVQLKPKEPSKNIFSLKIRPELKIANFLFYYID